MNYHIKTRIRNERIASFESFEDRDACFETLDKIYGVGIDVEDSIDDGADPQVDFSTCYRMSSSRPIKRCWFHVRRATKEDS